jgi:hypothetical protein
MRGITPDQLNATIAASPHYAPADLERWAQGQAFSGAAMYGELERLGPVFNASP